MHPQLRFRREDEHEFPVLVWELGPGQRAISTAAFGGGIGPRGWILNTTVATGYDRRDPDVHLAGMGEELGMSGAGVGLMTAVDVGQAVSRVDGGVSVTATVGIGCPVPAAAPDEAMVPGVGTINIVAFVPVALADAALVNAVATITEAKVQALGELGLAATGTPTDAVCCCCPEAVDAVVEPYGGPRSLWGARLARATFDAVVTGGRDWLAHPQDPT